MRKVYLLLTLFIVSLFFSSNVYAAAHSHTVNETELAYLTRNDFLTLREHTINYCNENNKKYVIACDKYNCYANIFNDGTLTFTKTVSSGLIYPTLKYNTVSVYIMRNGVFTNYSSSTSFTYFRISSSGLFTFNSFVDSNVETAIYDIDFEFTYDGFTLEVPAGTSIPTMYKFYQAYNQPKDKFIQEREVISNFYSVILEKIVLLANYFINNFFLMLILGIFILIFIFEIIRRRII